MLYTSVNTSRAMDVIQLDSLESPLRSNSNLVTASSTRLKLRRAFSKMRRFHPTRNAAETVKCRGQTQLGPKSPL